MSENTRSQTSSGIIGLDRILNGGLVSTSIIMILGGIGAGKSTFAQQFVYEGLLRGSPALYTTTDEPAARIRKNMIGLGFGVTIYERKAQIAIIDACGGQTESEPHLVRDPSKLSELERLEYRLARKYRSSTPAAANGSSARSSARGSEATASHDIEPSMRIVMDSITRLGLRISDADLIDFILRRIRQFRSSGLLALDIYAMNAHSQEFITTVSNAYDIILQLESSQDALPGQSHTIQVVKARQYQFDPRPFRYHIEPGVGIVIHREH